MKRRLMVAGVIGAAAMSAIFLAARAVSGVPTPSELFADRLAPFLPVPVFGFLLSALGGYTPAKIVGFSSIVIAQIVVGAAAALALGLARRPRAVFLALAGALAVATLAAFWPILGTQYHGVPADRAHWENTLVYVVAFAVFALVTIVAARELAVALRAGAPSRRAFLAQGIAAMSALVGGASWFAVFRQASFPYDGATVHGPGVSVLTPAERFYCVTKNVTDPNIDPALWRLAIGAPTGVPVILDLPQLSARAAVHQETTLMCINNPPEGGLMSNAIWTGVPLRDLLGPAAFLAGVRRIGLRAADNYIDTISLAKALEPTTLVAWQMNGEALLPRHGAPVRMIVPGLFGEKNVKWLSAIELLADDTKGFYERQGWGPSFVIPTHSRIDAPETGATLGAGTAVTLHGVAFAGDRGVTRVEVSIDGGVHWNDARFESPFRQLAWRLWSFDWRVAGAGTVMLVVRATDGTGAVQTANERPAATEGATGLHHVMVQVG